MGLNELIMTILMAFAKNVKSMWALNRPVPELKPPSPAVLVRIQSAKHRQVPSVYELFNNFLT